MNDSSVQPATEKAFREVWEQWCCLGNTDFKAQILFAKKTYRWPPEMVAAHSALRVRFPAPLDAQTHGQAAFYVELWESLKGFFETTTKGHSKLFDRNLRWAYLDDQTPARLAIVRAVRHAALREEVDIASPSPSLRSVQRLEELYKAYVAARTDAMQLLMEIVFPESLRTRKPIKATNVETRETFEFEDAICRVPPKGIGIPRTVPWDVEVAQLEAMKRLSPTGFREYFATEFPFVASEQRLPLVKAMQSKAHLAKIRCGTVAPWLADNAPLLRALQKQWTDVTKLVETHFPQKRPFDLPVFASRHGIKLGFKRGGNFINAEGLTIGEITPLLSPPFVVPS